MKKIYLVFLLAFAPLKLHALITDEGVTREKTVAIHFSTSVAANTASSAPASFLLISLSTTTGYPHSTVDGRGELDISHINLHIDKLAASSGTVKVGVVNFVNPSTASVTFFDLVSFTKNVTNTDNGSFNNYTSSFYRCKVNPAGSSAGTTPYILSNDIRDGTFLYNSTTTIASPFVSITPKVGDIIMEATNSDMLNTIIVNIDLLYHSER